MSQATEEDLMIRAAWMYYDDDMTHQQIADKLRLSRVKVTRLLKKARETGIVEIKVSRPLPLQYQISRELESTFNLKEAVVVNTSADIDVTLNEIGRTSVEYLAELVRAHCTIGFGWSSTVSRMSKYLSLLDPLPDCRVVDLVGSVLGQVNPYSVSSKVADAMQAPLHPLPVPIVVKNDAARAAIINDPNVRAAMSLAKSSDVAFVGIGESGPQTTLLTSGYLDADELETLQAKGVVGDILMRFYDIEGNQVSTSLDDYVIGLDWKDMHRLPYLVVVAGGMHKVDALLGILRSGICRSVVTDVDTAIQVLEQSRRDN